MLNYGFCLCGYGTILLYMRECVSYERGNGPPFLLSDVPYFAQTIHVEGCDGGTTLVYEVLPSAYGTAHNTIPISICRWYHTIHS